MVTANTNKKAYRTLRQIGETTKEAAARYAALFPRLAREREMEVRDYINPRMLCGRFKFSRGKVTAEVA